MSLTDKQLAESLSVFRKKGGGTPKDIWHPKFGWVLKEGKATPQTRAYYDFITQEEMKPKPKKGNLHANHKPTD